MAARPPHPLAAGKNVPGPPVSPSPGSKASKAVVLGGIGVVSLFLIGYCAAQDDYEEVGADCVDLGSREPDGSYTVVDDDLCDSSYSGSHGAYRWYYGGVRSGVRIAKGTTVRPSDVRITTRSGTVIQRGGFGGRSGWGSGS
ncbi:hypothetical protein GCM10017673_54020 [Streptosporangium violaceochromogenes]|nr:hypothetical protein GCM10017673_54020 [Streptosporangium violaceochromogenes]